MQRHVADENMIKFFEKLMALKAFVKEKNDELINADCDEGIIDTVSEIYKQLDAIIKNGDENE